MGAYCPAPLVHEAMLAAIEEHVLVPTVHAMKRSPRPFPRRALRGHDGHRSRRQRLEYNVRFGDPESQPLLMRLQTDLLEVLERRSTDGSTNRPLEWDPRPAVCVVMTSGVIPAGTARRETYPRAGRSCPTPDVKFFTPARPLGDEIVTDGGRVLSVTALGGNNCRGEAESLYRGEGHPLGRSLVPQGYLGQGTLEVALAQRLTKDVINDPIQTGQYLDHKTTGSTFL